MYVCNVHGSAYSPSCAHLYGLDNPPPTLPPPAHPPAPNLVGLRLGWVSGPSYLVERLQLHQQSSCLHASGLSQGVALAILRCWGEAGWLAHVHEAAAFYGERCDLLVRLAEKHLGDVAEWRVPEAGMFLWLRLRLVTDSKQLIEEEAVRAKVLMVPGALFRPATTQCTSPCVRASFSIASERDMEVALQRLGDLLRSRPQASGEES
jgi:kynurenine/2-aminoadipate aminotransferase